MRVLQTLYASSGNGPPQLAVTKRLVDEGHEVLVLGHDASRRRIEATGATLRPFRTVYPSMDSARPETDPFHDWEVRSPFKAAQILRDVGYLDPIPGTVVECDEAIADFTPDAIVYDFMLVGAAIAAEAAGLPAVGLVHCPYLLPTQGVPPYGLGLRWPRTSAGRAVHTGLRRAGAKTFRPVTKATNAERAARGLEPLDGWVDQLLRSSRLLVLTAAELDFAGRVPLPPNVRYVGPAFEHHDVPWSSPWPAGDDRPLIVISLSTSYMRQEDLAGRLLEAVADLPVRALLTAGPALDTSGLTPGPNTVILPFVPHREVFPQASLVVSHAGWGTINAALSCGVPLVCVPCGRDQPDGARRVEASGAGVIVRKTASTARLRDAIANALADEGLREGAARMADALGRQDGAEVAVQEITEVVHARRAPSGS